MTQEEARKVLNIMLQADGGCPNCASSLFYDFMHTFPAYKELAVAVYEADFGYSLDREKL